MLIEQLLPELQYELTQKSKVFITAEPISNLFHQNTVFNGLSLEVSQV